MKKILLLFVLFSSILFSQKLISSKLIGPGVTLKVYQDKYAPLYISVIEADLDNDSVLVNVGIANDTIAKGGETVSGFVKRRSGQGEYILAAVNGDFFGGKPWQSENITVAENKIIKGVSHLKRSLFGITKDKKPFTGRFKFNAIINSSEKEYIVPSLNFVSDTKNSLYNYNSGNIINIPAAYSAYLLQKCCNNKYEVVGYLSENSQHLLKKNTLVWRLANELLSENKLSVGERVKIDYKFSPEADDVYAMIGGLPYLVKDGKRPETYIGVEGLTSKGFVSYNPRTAVGFNSEKNKLYLVAVDGRNEKVSVGISLTDLADFMIKLGCDEAINLDGGGSTSMTVRNRVVNHPSDKTGERPVHNFLYIKTTEKIAPEVAAFTFNQEQRAIPSSTKLKLDYKLLDKWGMQIVCKEKAPYFYSDNKSVKIKDGVLYPIKGSVNIIGKYKNYSDTLKVKLLPGIE